MRQVSICIPTWNRIEMTIEAFKQVHDDLRVSEIVICDDCSPQEVYDQLGALLNTYEKVRLFRNVTNIDCYKNKRQTVGFANGDWAILFDSDNILSKRYLDAIFSIPEWEPDMAYLPTFAFPSFDYREFAGEIITKENVASFMDKPMFGTALNTMNFFINRQVYMDVWNQNIDPVTADSIYFNYLWLRASKKLNFVKGLEYFHRIHPQSHYQNNVHRTGNVLATVENELRQMK